MARAPKDPNAPKQKRNVAPRVLTLIVTVDDDKQVTLEGGSYNAREVLTLFKDLMKQGKDPQILSYSKGEE